MFINGRTHYFHHQGEGVNKVSSQRLTNRKETNLPLLRACFLLHLIFDPEDGSNTISERLVDLYGTT
jgi:hypothetical protein